MDLLTYRFKRTLAEIDEEQRRQRQWWTAGDASDAPDRPIVRAPLDFDAEQIEPPDVTQLLLILLLAIAVVALLLIAIFMFTPGADNAPLPASPTSTSLTQR